METENESAIDYGAILSDLEAKKAAIEAAIAGLKAMMGAMGTTEGVSFLKTAATLMSPSIHGGDIPAGAFLRKSIPEAAKLYLATVKRKQTTKEIADALIEGGMETNAKNFEITVGTGLYRVSKKTGEFVRLKGGAWGLSEWYPSAMRVSPEKREKRKGRKSKPKQIQPRESKIVRLAEKSEPTAADEGHHPTKLSDRAAAFINKHPNEQFTAKQLSEQFGIDIKVISMLMGRLVKNGVIRMSAPGAFCARQGEGGRS
jgi:hypothetical protein